MCTVDMFRLQQPSKGDQMNVLMLVLATLLDGPVGPPPPPPDSIVVMGDSIACQSKMRMKEVLRPNETVSYECKGGSPIEYWSAQGKGREALARHHDATSVIIFLGTNNYYQPKPPDVEPLLKEVRDRHLRCVWVGPTAVYGKKWPINPLLKTAVEKDCVYVDAEASGIDLPDRVHPSWESWIRLLKMIWNVR